MPVSSHSTNAYWSSPSGCNTVSPSETMGRHGAKVDSSEPTDLTDFLDLKRETMFDEDDGFRVAIQIDEEEMLFEKVHHISRSILKSSQTHRR